MLVSGQDVTERHTTEQQLGGLRRLAQDVAANADARQLVVEHAYDLLGATSVALIEGGRVTASRPLIEDAVSRTCTGMVCEPVSINGVEVAQLEVVWDDEGLARDRTREELLGILAQEMATALDRLRLVQTLERKAVRDVLTGAPNRRALDDELPRTLARAERTGEPLSVAALDLNAFKALNDTEGHDAGDRVLKACAAAWTAELRVTDMLVRLGGDEFLALLPDCPAQRGVEVAQRLRDATPHRGGSAVGVVEWDPGESAETLLRRADQALYADKAQEPHRPAGRSGAPRRRRRHRAHPQRGRLRAGRDHPHRAVAAGGPDRRRQPPRGGPARVRQPLRPVPRAR